MSAKKARIKPIDKNTSYDVIGKITKLTRRVRDGEFGEVTDAVVILRYKLHGTSYAIPFAMGASHPEVYTFMAVRAMTEFTK